MVVIVLDPTEDSRTKKQDPTDDSYDSYDSLDFHGGMIISGARDTQFERADT